MAGICHTRDRFHSRKVTQTPHSHRGRPVIRGKQRQPGSAVGAWLLSALTGDLAGVRRHLTALAEPIGAGRFFLAEFIVIRVTFEALVQKYLPADPDPAAVDAVAREAVTMVEPYALAFFGWPAPDLAATTAVIHRAVGDQPQPRYLGFGDEIETLWTSVSLALVRRHRPRAGVLRELILEAEQAAAEWRPPVTLTPAASGPAPAR